LSVYAVNGEVEGSPETPEEMQKFMERVTSLEAEMKTGGTFVFTGRLHDPNTATDVRSSEGDLVMTDGPFVESKERIAVFYIINVVDLDAALGWAGKVVDAINHAIEVVPFFEMPAA